MQEDDTGKQAFLNVYGVGVNTATSFNWSSIAGKQINYYYYYYFITILQMTGEHYH